MLSSSTRTRGSSIRFTRIRPSVRAHEPAHWLRAGTILYGQKRYDEAIPKLEEARARDRARGHH
jgi:hypothetical protein